MSQPCALHKGIVIYMLRATLFCVLFLLFVFPHQAASQEDEVSSGFYPTLDLGLVYDDNIYRIEGDVKADTFILANPTLLFLNLSGKHRFTASYEGSFGLYQENEDENFSDTTLNLDMRLDLTRKLNINLEGEYIDAHEARGGEGTKVTLSTEPDLFKESHVRGEVVWGRRTNTAQISFLLDFFEREYTNNEQEGRTREWIIATLDLYYNLGPKTSILAEIRQMTIDYTKPSAMNLDSNGTYFLFGAKWQATAKTQGVVKAGYQTKDLDDESLSDYEGFYIEGRITWEPKSYSKIFIQVNRATRETPQFGTSYYVNNRLLVGFEHDLSRRLTVAGSVNIAKDVFSNDREDDLIDLGINVTHSVLRWLDASLQYNYSSRQSTQESIDYTANTFMLKFSAKAF